MMLIANFLLQLMSLNMQYVEYLQKILADNHLTFQSEQQYLTKNIEQLHTKRPPLQTNLTSPLTGSLIQRYSRQMLLKQIAYLGQEKIIMSKVAVVGAGGIGCPLAMYLAAAGFGTIGIFDSDTVDQTNLHRQIGHRTSTIGKSKTHSLKNTLLSINPHIKIIEHPFITVENSKLLDSYDLIIDGSDNPTCRYIVNDYCMKSGKKLLSGACIGWEAQITCYGGGSPCYRCLWGNDQVSMGGCSTLGVVGMLPGIVGLILATEALKLTLNGQSSLEGKLLTYDGRKSQFKKISLRKKQPTCIACSHEKLSMETYDYAKYSICSKSTAPDVPQITWQQFIEKYNKVQILDVRPSSQYEIVHLLNSKSKPYQLLSKMTREEITSLISIKDISEPVFVSCARGVMSKHAAKYMKDLGFNAISIEGGIFRYRDLFDSQIPQL